MAPEAIGPLVTLAVWIAILGGIAWRRRDHTWLELVPVLAGIVILQLLLDLLAPHLGDIVFAAAHGVAGVVLVMRRPKRETGCSTTPRIDSRSEGP